MPDQSNRPTAAFGDYGSHVVTVQECLKCDADGEFGSLTEQAVVNYQRDNAIKADGIVGPETWSWLERDFNLPPYPPPLLPPLEKHQVDTICELAGYDRDDRGVAPLGYLQGVAFAWADMARRLRAGLLYCFAANYWRPKRHCLGAAAG